MSIDNYLSLLALVFNLTGFLLLVKEVRYAHLTEFHNLNLDELKFKLKDFEEDPNMYFKKILEEQFGESIADSLNLSWDDVSQEKKQLLRNQLLYSDRYANIWQRKIPIASVKKRMRWLKIGASLVILGTLLQIIVLFMQQN